MRVLNMSESLCDLTATLWSLTLQPGLDWSSGWNLRATSPQQGYSPIGRVEF